ncbi:unnamed protein product [Calypogeia fissa]
MGMEASSSKPKFIPRALQSKDKPRTPSPPRHTEDKVVATPPKQPEGTSEPVDTPMGQDKDGLAISNHSDVSLPPDGVNDRFMDATETMAVMQQGEPMEVHNRVTTSGYRGRNRGCYKCGYDYDYRCGYRYNYGAAITTSRDKGGRNHRPRQSSPNYP